MFVEPYGETFICFSNVIQKPFFFVKKYERYSTLDNMDLVSFFVLENYFNSKAFFSGEFTQLFQKSEQ